MNPLLSALKLPGQTVKLPSGGVFYKNGELADSVKNGEVHVYPLTAYHEILLKSPDFLLNGTAVEKIFIDCIPEIKKPLELITKDVDFLFICLRKITFGDEIDFEYTHYCDNAIKHRYVILVSDILNNTVKLDLTTVDKEFVVELDEYTIKLVPLKFMDFINLNQIPANKLLTIEEKHNYIVSSLTMAIDGVKIKNSEYITDKQMIREWMTALDANSVRKITEKINNNAKWGPTFSANVKCSDCGEEFPVDIPVNPVLVFF